MQSEKEPESFDEQTGRPRSMAILLCGIDHLCNFKEVALFVYCNCSCTTFHEELSRFQGMISKRPTCICLSERRLVLPRSQHIRTHGESAILSCVRFSQKILLLERISPWRFDLERNGTLESMTLPEVNGKTRFRLLNLVSIVNCDAMTVIESPCVLTALRELVIHASTLVPAGQLSLSPALHHG